MQDGSKAWAARGILTDAGHLLLRYTERLLALSTDAITATRDVQEVRTGSIYLAASQTTGVYLLPKLIGGFHGQSSLTILITCLMGLIRSKILAEIPPISARSKSELTKSNPSHFGSCMIVCELQWGSPALQVLLAGT